MHGFHSTLVFLVWVAMMLATGGVVYTAIFG
jgi:hypothetical protein